MLKSINKLRDQVLNWVRRMRVGPTSYSMGQNMDATIFSAIFALYIFDLFDEVQKWPQEEYQRWVEYIRSFQDESSGYFIPEGFVGDFNTKPVQQLTAFCLSVLNIFAEPTLYNLRFLHQWQTRY